MTEDIIQQGEQVCGDFLKRSYHLNQPDSIVDPEYTKILISKFDDLDKKIQHIKDPKSRDEVLTNELKRISKYYVSTLSEALETKTATPKEVIDRYFIKNEDVDLIKVWLKEKREQVLVANKRQFELYSGARRTGASLGSRIIRDQAEALVESYLGILKQVVQEVFDAESYRGVLNSFIISTDSSEDRAYAGRVAKIAMVSTKKCTYSVNGTLYIDSVKLIGTFGHEVLGHCLNYYATEKSDLPVFIKENYFPITSASRESIADYFKKKLFNLLATKPASTKPLDRFEPFERVFQRFNDTSLLGDYHKKLNMLGLWVLSNSKMNDYDKQASELVEYSIEPKWVSGFLNRHRNNWNRSTGFLLPEKVEELRYSLELVERLLNSKKPADLNRFEQALLTGTWSPEGLEEWVNLIG